MFTGNVTHKLDPKSRLAIPAGWRAAQGVELSIIDAMSDGYPILKCYTREAFAEKIMQIRVQSEARGIDPGDIDRYIGIITGRNDPCVLARMSQLGVTEFHAGFEAKLPKLEAIRQKYGLKPEEMAYMGDDWIDLDPMRSVGMPIAVANAVAQVKKEARYVTAARGGDGAVREAIEFLLNARLEGKNPADFWTAATGPARI